jgi:quinol monooxygenase YgiN
MTAVLCHFRVADYDAWRRGYDQVLEVTPGVLSFRIWRGQDDPGLVMVEETFETRDEADAAWKDPEVEAAMAEHGIDLSSVWVAYFDETGASAS